MIQRLELQYQNRHIFQYKLISRCVTFRASVEKPDDIHYSDFQFLLFSCLSASHVYEKS